MEVSQFWPVCHQFMLETCKSLKILWIRVQNSEKLGIRNDFCFFQDNERKHILGSFGTVPLLMQAPQSPDLNVIRQHQISNQNDFITALKENNFRNHSEINEFQAQQTKSAYSRNKRTFQILDIRKKKKQARML